MALGWGTVSLALFVGVLADPLGPSVSETVTLEGEARRLGHGGADRRSA